MLIISLVLVVAACAEGDGETSGDDDEATPTTAAQTEETPTTGATGETEVDDGEAEADGDGPRFIYVTPNPIGENEFLEMGEVGTQTVADRMGGTMETFESSDPSSSRANIEAAVAEAPDVIVLTTFQLTDLGQEFAEANPEQNFVLVDDCPEEPAPNLYCVGFREHEGAYLLGIMAGNLTETNKIGSVIAVDIPFFHRWSDSFYLGAQSVNDNLEPDTQVVIGGDNPFADPARAKEQALSLAAQDLDHIFSVGAGSDVGVFEAAQEEGFFTYGTDVNNCPVAPDVILDNNLKHVDVAVETVIDLVLKGEAEPFTSVGLAEGGVGVMALQEDELADSECLIADHPAIVDQVREAAEGIIAGEIEVPDPLTGG
ncbi:MAG: BMP family ABC transporter substrate-binding protein [Acidimicrobiia bacterium]|nr:BMP family ABC transporter substrate-binding protein [Acidimicrobiia bacterium]